MKLYKWMFILMATTFVSANYETTLTREKAKSLILAYHNNPWVEVEKIKLEAIVGERNETVLKKAVELGLLKYYKDPYAAAYGSIGGGNVYSLTTKGGKYVYTSQTGLYGVSSFMAIVGCGEFGEITGIKMNPVDQTAIVEYTWVRKSVTPFGEAMDFKKGTPGNATYKIKMTLYDDGWRVMDNESRGGKPSEYTFFTKQGDFIPESNMIGGYLTQGADITDETKPAKVVSDYLIVISDTAFFYKTTDRSNRSSNAIPKGTVLNKTKETISFFQCNYTNKSNVILDGYVLKTDVKMYIADKK